jgi:urea carboxylase
MFHTVLIANRGEIAVRAIRTLKKLGIRSVAVYSDADRDAAHVRDADTAVALGGEKPAESYLRMDALIEAAKRTGAQAVFPGYGFLSESAEFADACERAGIAFVGPTAGQIREFGLKHRARELAAAAGVPMVPGTGLLSGVDEALGEAARIGYPVMLKSTAGGGGIGLSRCNDAAELVAAFEGVQRMGAQFFRDAGVFLERYVDGARHIEVQIFGDGAGRVAALGERDCSVQRRNQKVIEETPAPLLPSATRTALLEAAVRLGESVAYRSAGTVEFIYDAAVDRFYFLEVNTRLQVEHPVTEAVTGLDLVECMLRVAAGDALDWAAMRRTPQGAAIEVRLYAEDPLRQFQPSPGVLTEVRWPAPGEARIDGWVETGTEVPSFYDPMLAKLIVHGADRADALSRLAHALARTRLSGIATNLDYLRQIVNDPEFQAGRVSTRFLDSFDYRPAAIEVLEPGTYTSIQDYPGRAGYWDIGVPPSGPMDDYAFRVANRIVGNDAAAAGLEATLAGPSLRFHGDTVIALTGGKCAATLDGAPVAMWQPVNVRNGQVLRIGRLESGCRIYLAVRGGFDVPLYLGSRSTFVLGQFGGHAGRILRMGDMLALGRAGNGDLPQPCHAPQPAPAELIPEYGDRWEIGVLYGPHGAPDFFTQDAIDGFFSTDWEAHYNSNRLGVRLLGPKPGWARENGGEAGLHPSNIHDCEYAIGSINFTGDSPVILTRDGPSLGGFVCPATIAAAELWKVGQVKPGDRIRFKRIQYEQAARLARMQDQAIDALSAQAGNPLAMPSPAASHIVKAASVEQMPNSAAILAHQPAVDGRPAITYRQAGDGYLLLEYGENVLDLALRMRVHLMMGALRAQPIAGVEELSPGVRSLQIRYDGRRIDQPGLVRKLLDVERSLPDVATLKVPTRVIHLPMAFEDSATLGAVQRYRETVRGQAPWLPNNVDFIQRINGLASRDDVRRIVFETSYLVMGLGDVYLGAPCAVPVDPRHRLLTSKYNPARTFTAEGTVGIGGVYMCIYGMDSPGGYQLIGRTLPIWNKFLQNPVFQDGKPWLLRFFDQVRFYPVEEAELDVMRADFRVGRAGVRIEEEVFDFAEHQRFLADNADDIAAFQARQRAAFDAEVALWQNEDAAVAAPAVEENLADEVLADGHSLVAADMCGSVWKIPVEIGQKVEAGDPLVVIEAMKMELTVVAPHGGVVSALRCSPGRQVNTGDPLVVLAA